MEKNKFNNVISFIKSAINNDKLVVFAGAGVSKDSGIPLWFELINEIRGYLNEKIKEEDPLKIAQILHNEKGEKEYNDIIEDSLFKNKGNYNPLHEIIFELNPQHIVTTNYDNYFENVIETKGLPFSIVSKDIDLPYAKHKKLLIKYHGDFENKNIIFKETDYLEFSKNNTLKEIFVKSLFSNKVILFVGYNVGDINLKLLIRDIQFILTKHHQRAYLLRHNTEISNSEIRYFENLGINIISYCEESLKSLKEIERLSSVGKLVYKQLEYIRNFDLFEYKRSVNKKCSEVLIEGKKIDKGIIDDLYTSLYRFYYFRVLPKNILASLYPLNKNSKNKTIYNIEANTIISYYKKLYDLIDIYKGKNDENFNEEEKKKLNFAISRLIYSNIYYIGEKVGNPDSFGTRRTGNELNLFEKYFTNEKDCDCIDCTIRDYRYSDALLKIEKYEIIDNSDLWSDLVYAYSLYKIGEYYRAYKSYELIEIKANRLKQMDVSFISKYNMKRIGLMILSILDNRYSFKDFEDIQIQAENIDLDKELDKTKYFVDKDVYIFLREVRDGIYIQRLCNEIDNYFVKTPNDVKNIQRGGSTSNSDYFNLYNAVKKLNDFLKINFIIGNGFSAIEYSINKSIKTFILGFYVGTLKLDFNQKRFGISKLDSFNHFLFELIIDYKDSNELFNFIKDKNISNLKFTEGSQSYVFKFVSNFFKSSFEIAKLFNEKIENEFYISYLNYNINFKQKILRQFKNICVVLTYFEYTESQLKSIYSDLNQFIKFVDFEDRDAFMYLKYLIENKYGEIGYELLEETFNILNQKEKYDLTYIVLLRKLRKLNSDFINGEFEIRKYDFGLLMYEIPIIYYTLPQEKKGSFFEFINKQLKKHQHTISIVVYILISENIPVDKEIKSIYIEGIHKSLKINRRFKEEDYSNHHFLDPIVQYFDLIYSKKIKDTELMELNVKEELFKFIIKPEVFDEKEFDIQWLKIFSCDSHLKRFAKINYIIEKLQNYLFSNEDKEFIDIYLKLKKFEKEK